MVARDYMTMKVWDLQMEREPLVTIDVGKELKPILPDLYESDCIFDKFNVSFSSDDKFLVTGSYNNNFSIWGVDGSPLTTVDLASADRMFEDAVAQTQGDAAAFAGRVQTDKKVVLLRYFSSIDAKLHNTLFLIRFCIACTIRTKTHSV